MSSPNLNNIIIMGCILCYASVVLFGLDARFLNIKEYSLNCNARTAVLSIGFSLSFGAMFSKTWRVHKVFTAAKTLKKMAIKDLRLFFIVAALLAIDMVFFSCWISIDPFQAEELTFEELTRKEQDTFVIPALYQCICTYKTYFLTAIFAYKGILLFLGLFLAWETRNVTIPALNDSKYIGMSVYNVVVLSIIGAIVAIAFDGSLYHEAPYAISSLCLIVSTTVTLLLVFVPKIYQFLKKDEGMTARASDLHAGTTGPGTAHIHSLPNESPVVNEHPSSTCKATQTDCDEPRTTGKSSKKVNKPSTPESTWLSKFCRSNDIPGEVMDVLAQNQILSKLSLAAITEQDLADIGFVVGHKVLLRRVISRLRQESEDPQEDKAGVTPKESDLLPGMNLEEELSKLEAEFSTPIPSSATTPVATTSPATPDVNASPEVSIMPCKGKTIGSRKRKGSAAPTDKGSSKCSLRSTHSTVQTHSDKPSMQESSQPSNILERTPADQASDLVTVNVNTSTANFSAAISQGVRDGRIVPATMRSTEQQNEEAASGEIVQDSLDTTTINDIY